MAVEVDAAIGAHRGLSIRVVYGRSSRTGRAMVWAQRVVRTPRRSMGSTSAGVGRLARSAWTSSSVAGNIRFSGNSSGARSDPIGSTARAGRP